MSLVPQGDRERVPNTSMNIDWFWLGIKTKLNAFCLFFWYVYNNKFYTNNTQIFTHRCSINLIKEELMLSPSGHSDHDDINNNNNNNTCICIRAQNQKNGQIIKNRNLLIRGAVERGAREGESRGEQV